MKTSNIKMLSNFALITAAVVTTKIAVTMLGVLISIGELIAELTPDEIQRLSAYQVIIAYCFLGLSVVLASGMMIYLKANKRTLKSKLLNVYASAALLIFGSHLSFVYIFDVNNSVLAEFVNGFAWVPETGLAVVATLFVMEKMLQVGKIGNN